MNTKTYLKSGAIESSNCLTFGKVASYLSVVLMPVFCLALAWCGCQILEWILQTKKLPIGDVGCWVLFGSGICCGIAGAIGIAHLFFFLRRLEKESAFTFRNVRALDIMGWCSFVFLAAGVVDSILLNCLFLAAIGIVSGFMGILIFVIREVFCQGTRVAE